MSMCRDIGGYARENWAAMPRRELLMPEQTVSTLHFWDKTSYVAANTLMGARQHSLQI